MPSPLHSHIHIASAYISKMRARTVGFAGLLTIGTTLASPIEAFSTNPQITIKNGTLRGLANENLGVEAFLGLPYARAPVSSRIERHFSD